MSCVGNMARSEDLYGLMEVSPNATQEDIRQAYVRLAKKYHPDKNNNSKSSSERFKKIRSAYEVLSNPAKRHDYDSRRISGTRYEESPEDFIMSFPLSSMMDPFDIIRESFGPEIAALFEIPEQLFSSGFETRRRRRSTNSSSIDRKRSRRDQQPPPPPAAFMRTFRRVVRTTCDPSGNVISEQRVESQTGDTKTSETKITKQVGGKTIETVTSVGADGAETVTVKEDGVLKSRKIDGQEQITMEGSKF